MVRVRVGVEGSGWGSRKLAYGGEEHAFFVASLFPCLLVWPGERALLLP